MQGRRHQHLPRRAGNPQISQAGVGSLRRSDVQCAESAHISARLLAKNLQMAPVAESPLPRRLLHKPLKNLVRQLVGGITDVTRAES